MKRAGDGAYQRPGREPRCRRHGGLGAQQRGHGVRDRASTASSSSSSSGPGPGRRSALAVAIDRAQLPESSAR